ncbi:hypothetical protein [Thalassotalea aquiviva]|uniref:hypothetical protein n=1 Tax=Thalassotalea aquiviva TaxID=3242415 RepID=UPI00352B883B
MKTKFTTLAFLALFCAPSFANQFIQLATPLGNLPDGNVQGVRFNLLYGHTDTVKGLDFNLIGLSDLNNFTGLGLDVFGVQRVRNQFSGVSLGIANWHDNSGKGGVLGLINYTKGNFTGAQIGTFNYAGTLNGLQFGFINATGRINRGVQIGLINYDASGTWVSDSLPVFPIINGRF